MAIDNIELLVEEIDEIDHEIRQIHHRITTMLVQHQQPNEKIEQEKKFFALVGELAAAGSRRIMKQENLLIARAERDHRP